MASKTSIVRENSIDASGPIVGGASTASIRRIHENVTSVNVAAVPQPQPRRQPRTPTTLSLKREAPPSSLPDAAAAANVQNICFDRSPSSGAATPVIAPPPPTTELTTTDPEWQSKKFSVRERNAVMFNNPVMADVWFLVGPEGDGQASVRIPAHRYVLATASSVFYAMLFGGLAENGSGGGKKDPSAVATIRVPDVEPAAFLALLRYAYCDECDLSGDNVLPTLYAAKKYIVPFLTSACVRFLESSLCATNACLLLSQSRLFDEKALAQRSWEVIDAQAEMALGSDAFAEIDFATVKAVLARETLNCRETAVFKAAVRWAEARLDGSTTTCREVLGDAVYLVRFAAMTVEEFADTVATSGILTLRETNDMFLRFTASRKPPVGRFSGRRRPGLPRQVCRRFVSSHYRSNQWRYRGRTDSIQFCVDRRIFVVGFGLYGSSNGSYDYSARIELKGGGSEAAAAVAENAVKFFSDGSSCTFKVYFKHPVQVEPDVYYTASAILDGAELSFFGQEGLSEVPVGAVTFQFQASSDSTNGTGVQGGQIPEIVFYGPGQNEHHHAAEEEEEANVVVVGSPDGGGDAENCQLAGQSEPDRSQSPQDQSNTQFE